MCQASGILGQRQRLGEPSPCLLWLTEHQGKVRFEPREIGAIGPTDSLQLAQKLHAIDYLSTAEALDPQLEPITQRVRRGPIEAVVHRLTVAFVDIGQPFVSTTLLRIRHGEE